MTPPLRGLVLAGGASLRMGRDKAALPYRGEPLVVRAWRLLTDFCGLAYVAVNAKQASISPYSDLPLIVDDAEGHGPATGLASAWRRYPGAAWLVLAADMPFVDLSVLESLLAARDPSKLATAFRRAGGSYEPLCSIWEAAARDALTARLAVGDASLRRLLERNDTVAVAAAHPEKLRSVNDPEAYDALES